MSSSDSSSDTALDETSLSTTITTPTVGGTQTDSSPVRDQQHPALCQDILVCGVCQREFALQDILKFISHKVNSCSNKENCRLNAFNNTSDDELDDIDSQIPVNSDDSPTEIDSNINNSNNNEPNGGPVINVRKQTPSIINNSSQRNKLIKFRHNRVHSSHRSHSLFNSCSPRPSDSSPANSANPGEKRTVADAYTNTINSGNG